MTRQVFLILLIGAAVLVGAIWYSSRTKNHAMNSGEVSGLEKVSDSAKSSTSKPEAADQSAQTQPTTPEAQSAQAAPEEDVVAPPATDSIRRNPPNGMIFAGRGKYQLYRQGDITWRLNTDTGEACILFATDAEWRKPKVFAQGCGH